MEKYYFRVRGKEAIIGNETFTQYWKRDVEYNEVIKELPCNIGDYSFFGSHDIVPPEKINTYIFGIPFSEGTKKDDSSVNFFPEALRYSSLKHKLYPNLEFTSTSGLIDYNTGEILMKNTLLKDLGDISFNKAETNDIQERIDSTINFISNQNAKFLAVGGDHLVTYFIVQAILHRLNNQKLILFQLDAHHDCGSNELHQEEVNHGNFIRYLLEYEQVAAIIQIGTRGMRSIDQNYTHDKLYRITGKDFNSVEYSNLITNIVKKYEKEQCVGYVSLDIDVLDPKDFSLVDFPIPNGPDVSVVAKTIESIFNIDMNIVGCDLVEGQGNGDSSDYDIPLYLLTRMLDKLSKK